MNANLTLDDLIVMEEAGEELLRLNESAKGLRLLALVLKLREELRYDPTFSFSVRVPSRFACEIDESAGMAAVYELQQRRDLLP